MSLEVKSLIEKWSVPMGVEQLRGRWSSINRLATLMDLASSRSDIGRCSAYGLETTALLANLDIRMGRRKMIAERLTDPHARRNKDVVLGEPGRALTCRGASEAIALSVQPSRYWSMFAAVG